MKSLLFNFLSLLRKQTAENRKRLFLHGLEISYPLELNRKQVDILHSQVLLDCDNPHTGETTTVSFAFFNEIFKITKPQNYLILGFNRGSCSTLALLCSDAYVTAIDIVPAPNSVNNLKLIFGDRFDFCLMNSLDLPKRKDWINKFELIFIDANHNLANVSDDIRNSLALNPKFLLLDDWNHRNDGKFVKEAAGQFSEKIKFIKEYANGPYSHALFLVIPD